MKLEIYDKPWQSRDWKQCDINHLKGYDYMSLTKDQISQKIGDYIDKLEFELDQLDTAKEKALFLASTRFKVQTKELYESLRHQGIVANGFTEHLVRWINNNLEYQEIQEKLGEKSKASYIPSETQTCKTFGLKIKSTSVMIELTEIMNDLKGKFISDSTKIGDFRSIFIGERVAKPIVWTGKNYALYFFVDTLSPYCNIPSGKWETTCECFRDEAGNRFDPVKLRKSKPKKIDSGNNKKAKECEILIQSICKPLIEKIIKNLSDKK